MKEITVSIGGSDGTPHGHGEFDGGTQSWDVTDEQYAEIMEYVSKGENDLTCMDIDGVNQQCEAAIEEIKYFAKCRGKDPDDYSIRIYICQEEED